VSSTKKMAQEMMERAERANLSLQHGEPDAVFLAREAGPELLAAIQQVLRCTAGDWEPCPCDGMMRKAVAKALGEA
jgi:hypothetical protein